MSSISESYYPAQGQRSFDSFSSIKLGLRDLWPETEPYNTGFIQKGIHNIYFEEAGNPKGQPAIFIHGGPGGGCLPKDRCWFDPTHFRIVLFDQRGCGRSTPHACLEDNTTWHLVEDIESIREYLGIEKWLVFGGSWGSTLSLAYAEKHPERVTHLVLRGIFTLRRKELEWFYQSGASFIFPDAWEKYLEPIPEEERGDMMTAYYKRLTSEDVNIRTQAAQAWSIWEGATSKLLPDPDYITQFGEIEFALSFARIECHYFVNKGFFKSDAQLIEDVHKIRHIPTRIVQGRYDIVCPAVTAWELHRAFPEAKLDLVHDAGHSSLEPGIRTNLLNAVDSFKINPKSD